MEFAGRGPLRAITASDLNDLISPYTQAAAWLRGTDPYSAQALLTFWPAEADSSRPPAAEFINGTILPAHGIPTAYPLTCFVLLGPFTVIPWPAFKLLYIALASGLFFAAAYTLVSTAALRGFQRNVFVAASLALAPVHTGMATCNLAIVAAELGIIGFWAQEKRRFIFSGLVIAAAAGLKPQIGLCFLFYLVLRRHWRSAMAAFAGILFCVLVALTRLALDHAGWVASYALDNRALFSSGVLADFTERNPLRFGLVNLQVAIYPLLGSRLSANVFAMLFSLALLGVCVYLIVKRRGQDGLLALSAIAVINLLPVYHRFYDAVLLLIPLAWLAAQLRPGPRMSVVVGLAMIAAFFVPGGSLLAVLGYRGIFSTQIFLNPWWNSLVMAHAVWCLVILVFILLYRSAEGRTTCR